MILLICRECGYFRDMTPMYFYYGDPGQVPLYNRAVTHCPDCRTRMYEVQKGDRLAVLPATVEVEKEGRNE